MPGQQHERTLVSQWLIATIITSSGVMPYICDILLVGSCSVGLSIDLLISRSGILVGPALMLPAFSTVVLPLQVSCLVPLVDFE